MLHCQHCGQNNTQNSNFCRFCGARLAAAQISTFAAAVGGNQFEYAPPRPYLWKTDELQLPPPPKTRPKAPKTKTIRQVEPLSEFNTRPDLNNLPAYSAAPLGVGYQCPRCRTQLFPRIEKQISTGGWIVFAVLLATFFPLFWIGFLIKDEVRVCQVCHLRFNP